MTRHDDDRPPSIGDQLDHIRWDYSPLPRERRFFLSPMSAFFGAFPWEGAAQTMPVPPRPLSPVHGEMPTGGEPGTGEPG